MAKCPVEIVDVLPWDINGDHVYELPATEQNYIEKYKDGRWFLLRTSTHAGLNGHWKTGSCHGSVICVRGDCPKLTTEGIVNTIDFKKIGNGWYECNSCEYPAFRIPCGCIKTIEFDRNHQTLHIEHQGTHRCHLKPNVKERRKILDDLPIPLSGSTKVRKHLQDCFRYNMENGDVNKAFDLCDAVSEADVVDKIKKLRKYPNKTVNKRDIITAFGHIAHIQDSIVKADQDNYLIYKWECAELNGKASYVFKTSEMSLDMGLKMAGKIKIGEEDSTLNEEPVYFDGMHERVKDFVTLTLWVFHPGMRAMQILAVMECTNEDSKNIEIFFDTFNKALAQYCGEEGYIWDPYLLMMDEKGANFEAITHVFGINFRHTKAVTCQFHFKQCVEIYLVKMPLDERLGFRMLLDALCEAHTIEQYRQVSDEIIAAAKE